MAAVKRVYGQEIGRSTCGPRRLSLGGSFSARVTQLSAVPAEEVGGAFVRPNFFNRTE